MAMSSKRMTERNGWVHNFEVSHPVSHKKGFTVYKVVSTVFPKPFPEGATKLTVWKRFNDFKKLYSEISLIHKQLYLSGEFPKFPKSRVFGRFDGEVIEERQNAALSLLNFSATHPQLYTSKVFVQFFESGYQVADLRVGSNSNLTKEDSLEKLQDDCLIPERVWEKPNRGSTKGSTDVDQGGDHISVNSAVSSSPDTPTLTDSDSLMSGSLLSLTSDTFVNTALPSSSSDYVLTSKSTVPLSAKKSDQAPAGEMMYCPSLTEVRNSSIPNETDQLDSNYSSTLVSNSASCSSLHAIQFSKANVSSSTSSLTRKKNGFGFFDFLPIFPKKTQQKKYSEEKFLADSLTASYICEAAGHFAVAQHHESNSDYGVAFAAYKEGIGVLLAGAQSDDDQKRRALVRNKLDKYLIRAETIHSEYLVSNTSFTDLHDGVLPSADDMHNLIESESSSSTTKSFTSLLEPSNITELKKYKVVGCLPNRVLIVVNMLDDKPKCFAVKVVTKSSCPVEPDKPTIMPMSIPFTVNIIQWFDTENSIVLLMPYVGGGKLIDFVKTYQTKQIAVISHDCSPTVEETIAESSFTQSTSTLIQENQEVLTNLSCNGSDNYELKFPNQNYPANYESCIQPLILDELSIGTQEIRSIGGEVRIGRKNKEVNSSKCFNGEGVEQEESERKSEERAGESNSENKSESRRGNESETIESDACPSLPYVCETKTEGGDGDNDDVKTFRHYHPNLKLPSDDFDLSTPEVGNFSQSEISNASKFDPSDESRDNITSPHQSNSIPADTEMCFPDLQFVDTRVLIESSKDLIQTVSKTLAYGRLSRQTSSEPLEHFAEGLQLQASTTSSTPFSSTSRENNGEGKNPSDTSAVNVGMHFTEKESKDDKFKATENVALEEEEQGNYDRTSLFCKDEDKKLKLRFKRQSKSEERPVDTQENDLDGLAALKRMVPECCIKVWAAEMILALEKLHKLGLTYGDLDMRNVLLGENGHILLSFTCLLSEVDQVPLWSEYLAPEARISLTKSVWNLHSSADWWSVGAILFQLLTGETVEKYHSEGFHAQTVLKVPDKNVCGDHISTSAKTLLTELLNFSPELRLGYYGAEEIKSHPFFDGFDWDAALDAFEPGKTI